MEKRYVVPEGMFNAAMDCHNYTPDARVIRKELEAALRWLAENPMIPTDKQLGEIRGNIVHTYGSDITWHICAEWQRRMFLSPEPEVPEEIIDLLCRGDVDRNPLILEAYRRGLKAGEK